MAVSKFLDPKNDVAFRKIFGTEKNKDILVHFINDMLELRGADVIKQVTFLSPVLIPEIAAKKESLVDVLCTSEDGTQIIVEMQVAPQEGFAKRAQYYAAKAYFGQLNRGEKEGGKYKDLKAVIFIAISDSIIFPDKIFYKSDHVLLDKDTYVRDLKDFWFTFVELPKFKITDINLLTNIIEKWCYFFKHADETSEADLEKLIGSDQVIRRAYDELNQFNWTEEELVIYDREIKRIMDNQAAEDYKNEQVKQQIAAAAAAAAAEGESRGLEKGLVQGLEKGLVQGLEKGKVQERLAIAANLLAQNIPFDIISVATGMSKEEIKELAKNFP
jgi:predicted transposase/invertase (TIGR01784 family)